MFSKKVRELLEEKGVDGKLPSYPDGYPVYYIDNQDSAICPDCAMQDEADDSIWNVVDYEVNYKDGHMICDQCSKPIPSAYGDDDVDVGEDDPYDDIAEWHDLHMGVDL